MWVVMAAGVAITLTIAFWQQIITWANQRLATWLEAIFGEELREAFQLFIAAADRVAVLAQRSVKRLQERLIRARIIFRQITGGTQHEKIVQAEIKREDGKIAQYEAAELVPWHELPDEVREKFIRRQNAAVEIELKLKE
ncbi:MAG: hypothetical protein OHK0023_12100 [Anaerolineae bacterium]